MYFFEELTKISLFNHFKNTGKPLDLIKAKTWFTQMASAVLYLHNHGLVHQKISLDWIYIKDGELLKLGMSKKLIN